MGCYLVTGIAGFIGSAVAGALLEQGHEVVGLDNLTTGRLEKVPAGALFVRGDCQDGGVYESALPRRAYDAVLHIAGQSSGEISFDDPVYDLRTNAESTLRLLRFSLSVGCGRFLYASSMSVYGNPETPVVSEDAPARPLSFYGVGKLASEHYLRLYGQYGIRSTALRLFNVYGEGQNMENMRQGMVSIYLAMMVGEGRILVKGSPERFRDFVHIADVVDAFLRCLDHPESEGREINIGGSGRVRVGDLVDRLCALSSLPVEVEYRGGTPGDIFGIAADRSLASACLGYAPSVSLEQGLARMYAWHTSCQDAGTAPPAGTP
ncbi:MAG: NAD-dependent epimerase/dehydratase family protein [Desulfovibrio sp.]|jgi:UDP-glucose 4-epimerase|nr:NAD-dependent epimerase/dehydratase family protein [Desulfovibrio sp.]